MKNHIRFTAVGSWLALGAALAFWLGSGRHSLAYERYKNPSSGAGNCSTCHGAFTDGTSLKGTVFPSNSKHTMHNASTSMATACNLCHTSGDNRNPYLGSSTGTTSTPGLGCAGCHVGPGLRNHHRLKGVTICDDCHPPPEASDPENVKPPYYGTADTKCDHPENLVPVANTNENWSVGDFIGLDNDGNGLYDAADFACGPYQLVSPAVVGNDIRITWITAGGRRDAVQASASPTGGFTNVASPLTIAGVGIITTNYLEAGGALKGTRFYRISYQP
ncbi:MAG TPA: hypothetical protein VJA21_23055 [Verrucomicrobiae bacterium]